VHFSCKACCVKGNCDAEKLNADALREVIRSLDKTGQNRYTDKTGYEALFLNPVKGNPEDELLIFFSGGCVLWKIRTG
jgi:hypothetical protein